jgi:hypothetical protein
MGFESGFRQEATDGVVCEIAIAAKGMQVRDGVDQYYLICLPAATVDFGGYQIGLYGGLCIAYEYEYSVSGLDTLYSYE